MILLVDAAVKQALHDEALGTTEVDHAKLLKRARDIARGIDALEQRFNLNGGLC